MGSYCSVMDIGRTPAKAVIAIGSGKGGVGKTTVALNLALALSETGASVGLLDADVYGPNVPLMVNLKRSVPARRWYLAWNPTGKEAKKAKPVEVHGIKVMSTGFLVSEDQPVTWNAGIVTAFMNQMLYLVDWGDLDYLIVDLPPGTADLQQQFASALPLSGAVIVVTPQDVAHLDARKAIQMYGEAGARILGAVLNMSELTCPHCGKPIEVFRPVRDDRSIFGMGTDKLGEIPLDPSLSRAGDAGTPLMLAYPDSHQADAFREIASNIESKLGVRTPEEK